jgi:hypothetical protein
MGVPIVIAVSQLEVLSTTTLAGSRPSLSIRIVAELVQTVLLLEGRDLDDCFLRIRVWIRALLPAKILMELVAISMMYLCLMCI